jgi:molybdopterin synthase catalytic subunit
MIRLSSEPIDPVVLGAEFQSGLKGAGAIVTFIGLVRPEGEGNVEALFLDHAPGVTESAIQKAVGEALGRWPLIAVTVVHRVGRVNAGAPVVFVATAAEHRRAAFESCDFLMDFLKTDAPFWKKQIGRSGEEWIEPRAEDYTDRNRWR